jgi:hypothetical protein
LLQDYAADGDVKQYSDRQAVNWPARRGGYLCSRGIERLYCNKRVDFQDEEKIKVLMQICKKDKT